MEPWAARPTPVERARRLTETCFVTSSDALVRVRAGRRALEDWRRKIARSGEEDTSALHAELLDSLSGEITRLSACARGILPLAAAARRLRGESGPEAGSAEPKTSGPASPGRVFITTLTLRHTAAELEKGLLGLKAQLRLLARARRGAAQNGAQSEPSGGAAPALLRSLGRLESQLADVGEDVAAFTRNAEQLSRELDRLGGLLPPPANS